jgi:hypothetical protein
VADQYAAPNTTTAGSDPVPSSNKQAGAEVGNVSANTTVACPGQGSYVDVSVQNTNPGVLFSGLNPTVTAHARVSLFQVSQAGGSSVLPYAITKSQAQNCCNNLMGLQINYSSTVPSQGLACDGSSNTTDAALMQSLETNGCPTTQISASPTTCATTTPPSCLAEFNGVAEYGGAYSFDTGLLAHFQNGGPRFGATCGDSKGNGSNVPVSTNYSYQLPTLNPTDPRLITIFVVPDNSFKFSPQNTINRIPILGYASFYIAGWDHDPCAPPWWQWNRPLPAACPTTPAGPAPAPGTTCDPQSPLVTGSGQFAFGQIWGYFVKSVSPSSSGVTGTVPCNPTGDASTADCVAQMTQ